MNKVLVTGATGFLGSHVVAQLRQRGDVPIAAARKCATSLRDVNRLAERGATIELDLRDPESISQALDQVQPDAVIHCAAYGVDYSQQETSQAIEVNVHAVALLVEAAQRWGVQRFIHVGTAYEYGSFDGPVPETAPLKPASLYGASKAAGTLLALERARSVGLPLCVVRPFAMYGPGEGPRKLVPLIQAACYAGTRLALTRGEQVRDYVFIDDAAAAILRLLDSPVFPAGETFNLGSGQPIRLCDWIVRCARFFGGEHLMDFGARQYRADELWHLVADTSKWERWFGSPIARMPLEAGLAAMSSQSCAAV